MSLTRMARRLGEDERALDCARLAQILARMDADASTGKSARDLAKALGTEISSLRGTPALDLLEQAGFRKFVPVALPDPFTLRPGRPARFVVENGANDPLIFSLA
ncbi:MAG: hypothetical protein ACI8QC_004197 [Planctomycetota bacterium]|jgi:hypothetical protein